MKAGKKVKKPLQTTLGKASDQDKLDLAEVRKPIHTSISNLREVFSALQNATEEVSYLKNTFKHVIRYFFRLKIILLMNVISYMNVACVDLYLGV